VSRKAILCGANREVSGVSAYFCADANVRAAAPFIPLRGIERVCRSRYGPTGAINHVNVTTTAAAAAAAAAVNGLWTCCDRR